MALFKRKDRKENTNQSPEINPAVAEQIHVMPQRFYIDQAKKKSGSFIALVIVGVVVILILASFAAYLYFTGQFDAPAPVEQPSTTEEQASDVTATPDSPTEPEVPVVATTSPDGVSDTATTTIDVPPAIDLSVDTDADNLTLGEEQLFGTDSDKRDTDGDGYADGAEVLNGYSPSQAGSMLTAAGQYTTYFHPLYSIDRPSAWSVGDSSVNKSQVVFSAGTGENVEVLVISNVNKLSLEEWFALQFPEVGSQAAKVSFNAIAGLLHPDGRNYYLAKPNGTDIFLVTYTVPAGTNQNFSTVFRSIASSFKAL